MSRSGYRPACRGHSLTEAAQSLGANWLTMLKDVIFPNLKVALLSDLPRCHRDGRFVRFALALLSVPISKIGSF
jgi:hypothetical protein